MVVSFVDLMIGDFVFDSFVADFVVVSIADFVVVSIADFVAVSIAVSVAHSIPDSIPDSVAIPSSRYSFLRPFFKAPLLHISLLISSFRCSYPNFFFIK